MANGLLNGIGNSYHETLDTLRIATKINACVKVQLSLACLQRLLSVREIRQLLVTSPPGRNKRAILLFSRPERSTVELHLMC